MDKVLLTVVLCVVIVFILMGYFFVLHYRAASKQLKELKKDYSRLCLANVSFITKINGLLEEAEKKGYSLSDTYKPLSFNEIYPPCRFMNYLNALSTIDMKVDGLYKPLKAYGNFQNYFVKKCKGILLHPDVSSRIAFRFMRQDYEQSLNRLRIIEPDV